jgi:fumarate reductase flavoprotein subunit
MGLPADALARTIAEWNAGRHLPDPLGRHHRPLPIGQPPFFAVRSAGGMLLSRGGPSVDASLRPIGGDGLAIKGCYAVGELLGMGQFSGDAFAGGMSVGPALGLGWWLAERIAAGRRC